MKTNLTKAAIAAKKAIAEKEIAELKLQQVEATASWATKMLQAQIDALEAYIVGLNDLLEAKKAQDAAERKAAAANAKAANESALLARYGKIAAEKAIGHPIEEAVDSALRLAISESDKGLEPTELNRLEKLLTREAVKAVILKKKGAKVPFVEEAAMLRNNIVAPLNTVDTTMYEQETAAAYNKLRRSQQEVAKKNAILFCPTNWEGRSYFDDFKEGEYDAFLRFVSKKFIFPKKINEGMKNPIIFNRTPKEGEEPLWLLQENFLPRAIEVFEAKNRINDAIVSILNSSGRAQLAEEYKEKVSLLDSVEVDKETKEEAYKFVCTLQNQLASENEDFNKLRKESYWDITWRSPSASMVGKGTYQRFFMRNKDFSNMGLYDSYEANNLKRVQALEDYLGESNVDDSQKVLKFNDYDMGRELEDKPELKLIKRGIESEDKVTLDLDELHERLIPYFYMVGFFGGEHGDKETYASMPKNDIVELMSEFVKNENGDYNLRNSSYGLSRRATRDSLYQMVEDELLTIEEICKIMGEEEAVLKAAHDNSLKAQEEIKDGIIEQPKGHWAPLGYYVPIELEQDGYKFVSVNGFFIYNKLKDREFSEGTKEYFEKCIQAPQNSDTEQNVFDWFKEFRDVAFQNYEASGISYNFKGDADHSDIGIEPKKALLEYKAKDERFIDLLVETGSTKLEFADKQWAQLLMEFRDSIIEKRTKAYEAALLDEVAARKRQAMVSVMKDEESIIADLREGELTPEEKRNNAKLSIDLYNKLSEEAEWYIFAQLIPNWDELKL